MHTSKEHKLTAPQRRELEHAAKNKLGVVTSYTVNGLGRAQWKLMMERLRLAGLVTPYVHGGYQITDAGRKVIAPEPARSQVSPEPGSSSHVEIESAPCKDERFTAVADDDSCLRCDAEQGEVCRT